MRQFLVLCFLVFSVGDASAFVPAKYKITDDLEKNYYQIGEHYLAIPRAYLSAGFYNESHVVGLPRTLDSVAIAVTFPELKPHGLILGKMDWAEIVDWRKDHEVFSFRIASESALKFNEDGRVIRYEGDKTSYEWHSLLDGVVLIDNSDICTKDAYFKFHHKKGCENKSRLNQAQKHQIIELIKTQFLIDEPEDWTEAIELSDMFLYRGSRPFKSFVGPLRKPQDMTEEKLYQALESDYPILRIKAMQKLREEYRFHRNTFDTIISHAQHDPSYEVQYAAMNALMNFFAGMPRRPNVIALLHEKAAYAIDHNIKNAFSLRVLRSYFRNLAENAGDEALTNIRRLYQNGDASLRELILDTIFDFINFEYNILREREFKYVPINLIGTIEMVLSLYDPDDRKTQLKIMRLLNYLKAVEKTSVYDQLLKYQLVHMRSEDNYLKYQSLYTAPKLVDSKFEEDAVDELISILKSDQKRLFNYALDSLQAMKTYRAKALEIVRSLKSFECEGVDYDPMNDDVDDWFPPPPPVLPIDLSDLTLCSRYTVRDVRKRAAKFIRSVEFSKKNSNKEGLKQHIAKQPLGRYFKMSDDLPKLSVKQWKGASRINWKNFPFPEKYRNDDGSFNYCADCGLVQPVKIR